MSGAFAVIFFMSQEWSHDKVIPTISALNVIVSIVTRILLISTGTIGRSECVFAIMFLPAAVLGIAGSSLLYKRIKTHHFRPMTFLLLIIAGILAIISGVREFTAWS